MKIIKITGTELSELLRTLRAELREDRGAIHTLRVATDNGEFKLKVNEGMWTPGYGTVQS